MNIFEKIEQLGLPSGQYVVVGGGTLVALGLLAWDDDVDICVAPNIFADLQKQGWEQHAWQDKIVLKHDVYDVGIGFGEWSLKDLQSDALYIKGQPFISLKKLTVWKRQMGRPKDLHHIALIDAYLKRNT